MAQRRRKSKWPAKWLLVVILLAAAMGGYWLGEGLMKPREAPPPPPPPLPKLRTVTLWLAAKEGDHLVAVKRQLPREQLPEAVAKAVLEGPRAGEDAINLTPEGTKVLKVQLKGPVAVIDLSKEFRDNFPAGEQAGYLLVYSLVNSMCELDEVTEVQLLIEGKKVEHLGGVSLKGPLEPDETLEGKGASPVGE